jgi:hypothetical protein
MIIQTSDNRFYQVTETGSADLAHVWNGIEVKLVSGRKGTWAPKKNARAELVRKAATRIVQSAA